MRDAKVVVPEDRLLFDKEVGDAQESLHPRLNTTFRIRKQGAEIAKSNYDCAKGQYPPRRGMQFLINSRYQFDSLYKPPGPEKTNQDDGSGEVADNDCNEKSAPRLSRANWTSGRQALPKNNASDSESETSPIDNADDASWDAPLMQ
jgi:hypothetical protein